MNVAGRPRNSSFTALRKFANRQRIAERCELCSTPLSGGHPHLVDPANHQIVCACDPCALLFSASTDAKYRRVPRDIRYLKDFVMTDDAWTQSCIPTGMAFFFHSSPAARLIAIY